MDLIVNQLYEFLVGISLGVGLSFFYACYRLQFHSRNYSRQWLWLTDSLWWLFAALVTVLTLFFLKWGALRVLFFLWLFLGFLLGYTFLWRPLCGKLAAIFSGKPKPPIAHDQARNRSHSLSPRGERAGEKRVGSFLDKPFDVAAEGIYQSYAYGKQHYLTAKKKQQAATEKWKKQLQAERQRLKHKVLSVLWPEQKRAEEPGELEEPGAGDLDMDGLDEETTDNLNKL
ncbi:MAG: hypothetical protein HFI72_04260 [Peptococcaceae bacterium]|nr:hypothetical protein [Peptococcaceae bacterium]